MTETVNHPAHYNAGRLEVIDVIEDWGLGFHLGNAVKYISRAERKGDLVSDLRKAIWYVQRVIELNEHPGLTSKHVETLKKVTGLS